MCHKRRQLVLSSGLWHPGCDVGEDIPLAREVEDRLDELEVPYFTIISVTRPYRTDTPFNWATSWENLFKLYANNKGADQPVNPRSLVNAFVFRCLDSIILLLAIAEISRP